MSNASGDPQPAAVHAAPSLNGASGPTATPAATAGARPELTVGAAFAGGLALALVLRRLAR